MYKGNDIIGKTIVARDSGTIVGSISDIVFSAQNGRVLALVADKGGIFADAKVVPFAAVRNIGSGAIVVDSSAAAIKASGDPEISATVQDRRVARGTPVMTEDGKDLGKISDIYFDAQTGDILGYEVSGGIFADALSGRSFLPVPHAFRFGENVAFVPTETGGLMEERGGGLKDLAESAKDRLHELQSKIEDMVKSGAADRVIGRRVRKPVRADDGSLIAAEGQIVTEETVARARAEGRERALLIAVLAPIAGEGAENARERAAGAWSSLKEEAADLRDRAADMIESRRIAAAVGRPVTRVILDQNDEVILDVGDIITHEAVERARQAGVLSALLASAARETPDLSKEDYRAGDDDKGAKKMAHQ